MDPLYLDHAATTPLRDEVRAAMEPHWSGTFGNPSSTHRWGREAAAALDDARAAVAGALGARPAEIHFVRGGTESDNVALVGSVERIRARGGRPNVVVSALEHRAVLDAARAAVPEPDLRVLAVAPDGSLDEGPLDEALAAGPCVVSLHWVNNEVGVVMPVDRVAARVRGVEGACFHTDAVQAVGKVAVRVDEVPVDLLSVTGHKIYGPKGTGALFVRSGVEVAPLLHGGGQERGLRPGTQDVAGAVGLATALRLAVEEQPTEADRLRGLRDRLEHLACERIAGVRVNAAAAPRAPHVSSLGVPGVDGEDVLRGLDVEGLAASGGSACDSGSGAGSHVIRALYGDSDAHATVRFSLGRATSREDVERAVETLVRVLARLGAVEAAR